MLNRLFRFVRASALFALLITISIPLDSKAAREPEFDRFADRIFYGGAIGMVFGYYTQIDIVPIVGIWVLPQWSVGVSGRYTYFSHRNRLNESYRANIWGYSAFTQIIPIRDFSKVTPLNIRGGIFLHGEYESLYVDHRIANPLGGSGQTGKSWVDIVLAGVGYRQKLGEKAAFNILFLWQLNESDYSPYRQSPILRVNITL